MDAGDRIRLPLFVEASRQLTICNACRYCEGLCAVFPALERRTVLAARDITQIANLCHDCRACFDACMYTQPHEFAINLPRALSAIRVEDYAHYTWPRRMPRIFRGWLGLFAGALLTSVLVLLLAVGHSGWSGLVSPNGAAPGSPYDLIPYGELLALLLVASGYSMVVLALAARSYWRTVADDGLEVSTAALLRATWYAATLRYLRGGDVECYYPKQDTPTAARRRWHSLVFYGMTLCFVSTLAAAVLQDVLHQDPPYSLLSVPVATGTIGGLGLLAGSVGLIALKSHAEPATSFRDMTVKDYGLLVALTFLALSGLATLLTRSTSAFGVVFLVHLASVVLAFASAPYSKLSHGVFRFAALIRDNVEREDLEHRIRGRSSG